MKELIKTGEETKYNNERMDYNRRGDKIQQRKYGLKQERRQNTTKKEWIKTGEETKYNKERMD